MHDVNLDCRNCTEGQKVDRGCEKDSPIPDRWQLDDWKFQRCPLAILDIEIFEYLRAYKKYENGYLPNEGGWLEQPAKFNDVIDIIDNEIVKINKKLLNKQGELAYDQ